MIAGLVLSYLGLGAIFGIAFFVRGYKAIDPAAADAAAITRLLWVPAAVALWPLLVSKWRARKDAEQ